MLAFRSCEPLISILLSQFHLTQVRSAHAILDIHQSRHARRRFSCWFRRVALRRRDFVGESPKAIYFSPLRMIGRPVFVLPITTILLLPLAASFSVASMPFHSSSCELMP